MEKKELWEEEGLFISDFTDDFFKRHLESEQGLEGFIQECAEKALFQQKERGEGIWNSILKVAVEEVCRSGLRNCFGFEKEFREYSDLERVLIDFYEEPFFLELDVAQKIIYNLYRLDGVDKYDIGDAMDMEEWQERYGDLLGLGRKMEEKDMTVDLLPGLDRIRKKYKKTEHKPKVWMQEKTEDGKIMLEANFGELNALYIGNEKFREYLYWKGRIRNEFPQVALSGKENIRGFFQMLIENIKILNEKVSVPQQYIWEKMTDFNALNMVAKFLTKIVEKNRICERNVRGFVKNEVEENYFLFRQITEMPNVLTRLLLLKMVFRYMADRPEELVGCYKEFNIFLNNVNSKYGLIQDTVLEVAVLMRWYMERENKVNRVQWREELEKEYPNSLFEKCLLFLSIGRDPCKVREVEMPAKIKVLIRQKEECTDWEELAQQDEYKNLLQEWERNAWNVEASDVRKYELLKSLGDNRYFDCGDATMEKLKEEGWIVVGSESYLEFKKRQEKLACEKTPFGNVCTITYSEYKKKCNETYSETTENIRDSLKPCLLSEYKEVIFENTYTDWDRVYKKIFNYIVYYIWE